MIDLIINLKEKGIGCFFEMRSLEYRETPLVLAGACSAIRGADQLASGNFQIGTAQLALGMAGIQLGTLGHNEGRRVFEKAAAVFGAGAFFAKGLSHLYRGSYLKAAVQCAAGSAFAWLSAKSAFDSRVPFIIGLIANSALLAASGARDLFQKRAYANGALKIGCALSIAAGTAYCVYFNFQTSQKDKELIFGTSYLNDQNPERNELSSLTNQNHAEYALRHRMIHVVDTKNRLGFQCRDPNANHWTDCAPYWNKIQMMRDWIQEGPKTAEAEEWRIFADDDMPVTNLKIDPREAIDRLRRGTDSSVIVAQDGMNWFRGDAKCSINTGLLFVRKDEQSANLFDRIWERRNDVVFRGRDPDCLTLGLCKTQNVLHEQEAFARVLSEDPSLFDRVVTVVAQRGHPFSDRSDLALNTFYREGAFQKEGSKEPFHYNGQDSSGIWQPGDWMGQPTGVPIKGWRWNLGYSSNTDRPARPVRKEMIQEMLSEIER